MFLIIADIASALATLSDIARSGCLRAGAFSHDESTPAVICRRAVVVIKLPAGMTTSGLFVARSRASFDTFP